MMAGPKPLVDVIVFNDEVDMLRYRIRLHAPIVSTFVVIESAVTFSGLTKQLHAQRVFDEIALAPSQGLLPKLLSVTVPSNRTLHNPWERETFQRTFVLTWLQTHFADHWVHLADVDELLDGRAIAEHPEIWAQGKCVSPKLRFFYYGEHCPKGLWSRSLIFHTASPFFTAAVRGGVELRNIGLRSHPLVRRACTHSEPSLGWHFSYNMDTVSVLRKLRGFSHAHDQVVQELLHHENATQIVDDRVRHCIDLFDRASKKKYQGVIRAPFDGRLPWLSGWPRHPLAPAPRIEPLSLAGLYMQTRTVLRAGNISVL